MTGVARRRVMGLVLALCALPAAAAAQDVVPKVPPQPTEWQATITTQIEAFRTHDAATAFSMAAAPFRTSFPDAESFYLTIVHSGYAAIALSRGRLPSRKHSTQSPTSFTIRSSVRFASMPLPSARALNGFSPSARIRISSRTTRRTESSSRSAAASRRTAIST